ncbi:MAG: YdeI/OmpD-associated family protein [Saprospiraceae bacterium]
MDSFTAKIEIIGVNPFVFLPQKVLNSIFKQAEKSKGAIPIHGTIDGHPFQQTLVRYSGFWRLYINTPMLKACQKKLGDKVKLEIEFDSKERMVPIEPKFKTALEQNPEARVVFEQLNPSRQKEILRYFSFLKSDAAIDRNVDKAIAFLLNKSAFLGRNKP